jgi:uncharacterized zinc-type alcohol dehydrogenase-like protein
VAVERVSADHDINPYLGMLRRDGNLTLVGAPANRTMSLLR